MGFLSHVVHDVTDECILCCLTLKELVRLDAAHSCVQEALFTGVALRTVLNRELKGITLNGSFRAGGTFLGFRREIKQLIAGVSRVLPLVDGVPVPLADVGALRELSTAVRRASAVADAHVAASGRKAQVFLARFRFAQPTESTMATSNASGNGRSGSDGLAESADQKWCVSAPMMFGLQKETPPSAAAVPTSAAELSLRLAWRSNTVQLSMLERGAEPRGIGAPPATAATRHGTPEVDPCSGACTFAVDICSLGRAPLLKVRSTPVRVNGPWQRTQGIAAGAEFGHAALVAALSPGLPCVVCVREDEGAHVSQAPKDAYALHLESTQWTRTPHRP